MSNPETIGDRIKFLIQGHSTDKCPRWPPDVFCVCASILHSSGAYSVVASDKAPHKLKSTSRERAEQIERIGESWRKAATSTTKLPNELNSWWKGMITFSTISLADVRKKAKCCEVLLNLLAASDEASHSLGICSPRILGDSDLIDDPFVDKAEKLLAKGLSAGAGATLCKDIHSTRGRVLPKMHTAQNGLTIRSLSHHLCYCPSPDVLPEWWSGSSKSEEHSLNLLVIPWPFVVNPAQFKGTAKTDVGAKTRPGSHGLFTFKGGKGPTTRFVRDLIDRAEQQVGPVHGVLFPELAMTEADFNRLAKAVVTKDRFLIGGIGSCAVGPTECGRNEALWEMEFALRGRGFIGRGRFSQKKHHRWKLTKSQIQQYGLSSALNPEADWWEHIEIGERSIAFATLRSWLTMTLLICEDLARPDPVGDLLRAVGPNLIIALLSDGPQLIGRWPGRYAGALADDPGSSVLTITSRGMSRLSRPIRGGADRSGTVALWRDALNGATEIEFPDDASALLLTTTVQFAEEWTADGRGDGRSAGYPILSGIHPIFREVR